MERKASLNRLKLETDSRMKVGNKSVIEYKDRFMREKWKEERNTITQEEESET